MMQEGEMPTTSAFGAGAIDDALQQNQIKPGRIATRFPTAVKATEDPLTQPLTVGLDDLKQDARLYDFNVNITKDYLNMVEVQDETTDQTAERFVDHVKIICFICMTWCHQQHDYAAKNGMTGLTK